MVILIYKEGIYARIDKNYDRRKQPTISKCEGVTITFIDYWNKEQFDVLGILGSGYMNESLLKDNCKPDVPMINGQAKFSRIIIKRRDMNV